MSDRELQFVAELTKELNRMLEIETKWLVSFHPQTDRQIDQMNQKLEQYLMFFVDHRQKDYVEFAVNNKVYLVAKISLFMVNYSRELRMGADIRRKEK